MKKAKIQRVRFFVTQGASYCRDNLCETCCKLIHKRVKAFAFHTIVDLRSDITEINTTTDVGNCLFHSNRSIEVLLL